MNARARSSSVSLACLLLALGACDKKPAAGEGAQASASAKAPPAPVASGLPSGLSESVRKVVNPKQLPAYGGPTGSVKGVVSATGDPAPVATARG